MKPTNEVRNGLVKASLFEREATGKSGKFMSQSISLQVGFKRSGSETIENKNLNLTVTEAKKTVAALTELLGLKEEN